MAYPLPQPTQHFEWTQAGGRPALVCRPLAALAKHLFTTREWTIGARAASPDDEEAWREVGAALDAAPASLVRLRQVHGAAVVEAATARGTRPDADIVINEDPALTVVVQAADCAPALFADSRSAIVAAAHAGWRGMAARVPSAAVRALQQAGADPADLVVAVGPSIGACCYEVGADVRVAFTDAGYTAGELSEWFRADAASTPLNPSMASLPATAREGHWYFDGWRCMRDQLVAAGVPRTQIFVAELCTATHPHAFPSYRRDGRAAGRLAAAIRPAGGPLRR